ncbi:MAG: hypothetical protein E6H66_09485 [Betaproteobacteria bacterium]|nr:MAG: hypothetical protein E6H66_09485 [Betaproteobacteria bacterium]
MSVSPPERREPSEMVINLGSGIAMVTAAALGAVAGAIAGSKLPADQFAWTGLALLPLFVLLEVSLRRLVTLFGDDRNAARLALAGAIVIGFYGAWFGIRSL